MLLIFLTKEKIFLYSYVSVLSFFYKKINNFKHYYLIKISINEKKHLTSELSLKVIIKDFLDKITGIFVY